MSQKLFINLERFVLDVVAMTSLLNATISAAMSLAMKMKSQHDPNTRFKNWLRMPPTAAPAAPWANHATKYPKGVFQSNGNLGQNEEEVHFWLFPIILSMIKIRTKLGTASKMRLCPYWKCRIWRRWAQLTIAITWLWCTCQSLNTYWTSQFYGLVQWMRSPNELLTK